LLRHRQGQGGVGDLARDVGDPEDHREGSVHLRRAGQGT
jgi:hypothetical protein